MNSRLPPLALFLFCLLILRAENARPPSETDVFERTRARINDIFQQRDHPPLLPAEMRNPFLPPDERPVFPGLVSGATLPGQLLELLAPTIPVRGIVETAGRFGIIVNRKIYYEGDSLLMEHNKSAVEIEIRRITGNTYTFGYGDAEMTLRLAN